MHQNLFAVCNQHTNTHEESFGCDPIHIVRIEKKDRRIESELQTNEKQRRKQPGTRPHELLHQLRPWDVFSEVIPNLVCHVTKGKRGERRHIVCRWNQEKRDDYKGWRNSAHQRASQD
jgi:hypothetical protein